MSKMFLALFVLCCVTRCNALFFDGIPKTTQPASHLNPIAETFCGYVRGLFNGKSYSFRGIPFALPPTGTRRWEMPVRLKKEHCWNGEYQATKFKSQCVQRSPFNKSIIEGSEDCLYLNVWTPTLNKDANLPVFVYIHGGSLQELNGSTPTYSPSEELANETNIVYVSMNYRLQAFGFLTLAMLSEHSSTRTSGNYGFMDQIAALEWVKANIQNFGGNASSVTVAGQSSGGTSIFALLASPFARGLFHKAWINSGSPILNKTTVSAQLDNVDFLSKSGCNDIYCLKNMTAKEVTRAVPWDQYPYWAMTDQEDLPVNGHFDGAIAVVDGYVLPEAPFDAWVNGHAIDVPLLISTTAQEVDMDPGPNDLSIQRWNWTDYENYVHKRLDTFSPSISKMALKMYPINAETPIYQFTSMVSDIRVNCPNDIMALYASMNSASPVYRYVLTAGPSHPVPVFLFGKGIMPSYAFHSWDMLAFFGSTEHYLKNSNANDLAYEANLKREILSFIRNGKPYTKGWYPFPRHTALVNDNIALVNGYHAQECNYWLQNGFFDYAWIN